MNIGIGCLAVLMALVFGLGAVFFATSSTSETVEATAAPMIDGSPTP